MGWGLGADPFRKKPLGPSLCQGSSSRAWKTVLWLTGSHPSPSAAAPAPCPGPRKVKREETHPSHLQLSQGQGRSEEERAALQSKRPAFEFQPRVTSGKVLHLCEPQCPHLGNDRASNIYCLSRMVSKTDTVLLFLEPPSSLVRETHRASNQNKHRDRNWDMNDGGNNQGLRPRITRLVGTTLDRVVRGA